MADLVDERRAARARQIPVVEPHQVVDDQLTAALEEIEQARLPFRPIEDVLLLDLDHRRRSALSASRSRVSRFSLASSSFHATSHSSRDTTAGTLMVTLLSLVRRLL